VNAVMNLRVLAPRSYLVSAFTLMMEAVSISETSVNFYEITRHNIPENSHLHTRCRENPESHKQLLVLPGCFWV
jgi:hypothetical protein